MTTDASRFVPNEADTWPLTPRTRFVLWQTLERLATAIGLDLDRVRAGEPIAEVLSEEHGGVVLYDFPVVTRSQPLEWWEEVYRSASRLREAARTGEGLEPRTPAEEVLLCMASQRGWTDVAMDEIEFVRDQFEALPENDDDFDWGEVLPELAGDGDVERLWMPKFDGLEEPDDEINQHLGMGDYRVHRWHHLFEHVVPDMEADG